MGSAKERLTKKFGHIDGFSISEITFTHASSGHVWPRKGISVRWLGAERIVFEPKFYNLVCYPEKWFVYGHYVQHYHHVFYAKQIQSAVTTVLNIHK